MSARRTRKPRRTRASDSITDEARVTELKVTEESSSTSLWSRFSFLRPGSPVPTVFGVLLVAAGFGLIAYTWGRVAGLISVPLQLPYFVSGGLTGLGLILVGLTVINVAARRQDAAERSKQMDQLGSIFREIRTELDGRSRRRR